MLKKRATGEDPGEKSQGRLGGEFGTEELVGGKKPVEDERSNVIRRDLRAVLTRKLKAGSKERRVPLGKRTPWLGGEGRY